MYAYTHIHIYESTHNMASLVIIAFMLWHSKHMYAHLEYNKMEWTEWSGELFAKILTVILSGQ